MPFAAKIIHRDRPKKYITIMKRTVFERIRCKITLNWPHCDSRYALDDPLAGCAVETTVIDLCLHFLFRRTKKNKHIG